MSSDDYTKQIVREMLSENTGSHMLDSGGAYGRWWSTNQQHLKEDPDYLDKQPEAWVRFDEDGKWEGGITTYRYLTDHFTANQKWRDLFYEFNARPEYEQEPWEDVLEAFMKEYDLSPIIFESEYDEEQFLNQPIIWWVMESEDDMFVIIRSHNGCDLRGGWSGPQFFNSRNKSEYDVYISPGITLWCPGPADNVEQASFLEDNYQTSMHAWDTDPRSYPYGTFEHADQGPNFGTFEFIIDPDAAWVEENGYGNGRVVIEGDKIHCPYCGNVMQVYIQE